MDHCRIVSKELKMVNIGSVLSILGVSLGATCGHADAMTHNDFRESHEGVALRVTVLPDLDPLRWWTSKTNGFIQSVTTVREARGNQMIGQRSDFYIQIPHEVCNAITNGQRTIMF